MFVRSRVLGTLGAILALLALIPPWCVHVSQTFPFFRFVSFWLAKI
jgi:hypothetical protein